MLGLGINESKLISAADSRGSNKEDKKSDTGMDWSEVGLSGSQ